jgi:transcriptional regulator with XRE-family HTH domain
MYRKSPIRYFRLMRNYEHDPRKGLNAAVAATLNAERVAAGLTFEGLADLVGISKRTLMRQLSTESSERRHIDVADMADIAAVFRLTASDVLRMAEERMGRTEVPPNRHVS